MDGSPLTTNLARVASAALDLLMPMRCFACDREGPYVCGTCEPGLPRLRTPYCRVCATPGPDGLCELCAANQPAIDRIIAPYLMDGSVRSAVHDLKYRNLRAAAPTLGRLMASHLLQRRLDVDVVMPVPIHSMRERARGYNQSLLLAKAVSRETELPLEQRALRKVRDTAPQVSLPTDEDRRANLDRAFECVGDQTELRVVLIDDVVTTGSTMFACAEALVAAGASAVYGLALAREP